MVGKNTKSFKVTMLKCNILWNTNFLTCYKKCRYFLIHSHSLKTMLQFSSIAQSCQLFVTPWTAAGQASLSITNSRSSLKLMSIQSVMQSKKLILCHPLLLPSIFPSIRAFSNKSVLLIRWPKYWIFSFIICTFSENSALISFRIGWFKGLSRVFSHTTVQKHQSFGAQLILWSNSHIETWLLEKP